MKNSDYFKNNTCAFIDVLGYKNIVISVDYDNETKLKILNDIYKALQDIISEYVIKRLRNKGKIEPDFFIKSFSDSIFIQSDNPYIVLYSMYTIFSNIYGYYIESPEKRYTPIYLRGGIVKDWTYKLMDVAPLSKFDSEEIKDKDEYQNLIGLGVARAYHTSEKSNLSGMRIIISPETFKDIELVAYNNVSFECYYIEGENFLYEEFLPKDNKINRIFVLPIRKNEKGEDVNLYEICWPVYKYLNETRYGIDTYVEELLKSEQNFNENSKRHFYATAILLKKSYEITITQNQNAINNDILKNLNTIIERKS